MTNNEYYFLEGGGEMGQLIRDNDWSKTPLGNPDAWPQSLRTLVAVMLNNPIGMYIAWGTEMTQIYNDAYRTILGDLKHPKALGISTPETFSEAWDIIGPMFEDVMNGQSVSYPDFKLMLNRKGYEEACYFDFSYTPIKTEDGKVGGVLITVIETTQKVLATEALKESNYRFLNHIIQAPVAMCVLRGKNYTVEIVNDQMIELWGKKDENVVNQSIFDIIPEPQDKGLAALLAEVYKTGEKIIVNELPVQLLRNGKLENTYINYIYQPHKESDGTISGIVVIAVEVTDHVVARYKIQDSEQKIRQLIENAPFPIGVYVGKDIRIELANQSIIDIWGKGNDVIGKSYRTILPELENQLVYDQITSVMETGESFHARNTRIDLVVDGKLETFYFSYSFTPLYDKNGNVYAVMNTAANVTDLNLAKQKIEENENNLRSMVQESPIGICVLDAETLIAEMVNESFIEVAGKTHNEIVGKHYWDAFAEVKQYYQKELDKVIKEGIPFDIDEVEMELIRHGKKETIYVTFVYAPLKNIEGKVTKVAIWVLDNTPQVATRKKIEEADKRFRNTVKQAPVGITILRGKEYMVEMANETYLRLVGREETALVGKPLFESLPEVKETVSSLLEGVMTTGISFHGNEVPVPIKRGEKLEILYFDFLYHPLKEENGEISGIIVTVTEVTDKVQSRKITEQNEERLNIIVEASELGTWELNVKSKDFNYSQRYLEIIVGISDYTEIPHEELVKHIHPEDLHIRVEAFEKAIATGYIYYESRVIWNDQSVHWVEAKGKVFYDENNQPEKLIGTARDITDLKKHQQELEESEKRFRSLTESIPQLIWETDEKGNALFASGKWLEYTGIFPGGITEWKAMIHPDDYDENIRIWNHCLETGDGYRSDVRIKSKEGEYRWHTVIGEPVLNEENKIIKWVGAFTDIQAEKTFTQELENQVNLRTKELYKINESLRKSEERYHLMIEEVQDYAILYLNHEGIVENWNIGAEKIKGYKAEEIIGKYFSAFYTEEDRKNNLPQKLLQLARDKGKALQEGWRIRKDGTLFWASVVITAVHNKKKEVIGFSKVTHDLTEKKKAEDKLKLNALELEQKNVELEQMNKDLQSFTYISSHDLQEPLRKIQTFASQIIDREVDNLSEIGIDKFKRIQNAAQRMQALINDLLTYSRASIQDRVFEKTDLSLIIKDVKEDLKEELEHKNATIEEIDSCEVQIIPFQFRQLIYNLVSNSLKFSKTDVLPVIKIKCNIAKGKDLPNPMLADEVDYCHISIIDNGIGFDQEYNSKIFEVFQRLHGRERYAGTGIGLAIVKKIVENHNGFITANGEANKGATFNIFIPIALN
ncbi:PAS domain S-box protein [Flavobacterium hydrocarbonoxydans]|nr:PAS domain S-box protein [Flavobacterium hydrocarbonoxydans]